MRQIRIGSSFESWQSAARELLRAAVPPHDVEWREQAGPTTASDSSPVGETEFRVPRRFVELAKRVVAGRASERWALLYRVLWRIVHENHDLLQKQSDLDVYRLLGLERESSAPGLAWSDDSVRQVAVQEPPASFEPTSPVASPPLFPAEPLPSAAAFVPASGSLDELRAAAKLCKGCELHSAATQTVFGLGPATARVMMVGEQPGDQEDLQGAPFVGPAGQVLDRAMAEAGLPREEVYVTNVVKHFKFTLRGKRRLHETPRDHEILACRPWLEAELGLVKPEVLVCLGATAARAILGPWFRITRQRGEFLRSASCPRTLATFHPSAVLRAQETEDQERIYALLRNDLRTVAAALS